MDIQPRIKQRLADAGFTDQELEAVVIDVHTVIAGALYQLYLSKIGMDAKEFSSPQDLFDHLQKESISTPRITTEEFEAVYQNIWQDYFATLQQR